MLSAQNSAPFFANASSKEVIAGTDFTVEFVMNNIKASNFQPPVFDYFDVVSGPNRTSSYSNLNGKISQQIILSYILRAKEAGTFPIRAAYCTYKGQKLATTPFNIEVKERDSKSLEALGLPTDQDIFVRMEVARDTAYMGEKVEILYKLYTKKSVRSYDIKTESNFDGFYAKHQAARKSESGLEEINGEQYSTQVLEKRILFPQQTGIFDLEPARITLGLPDGRQRSSSFFFSNNLKPFPVETNGLKLNIVNLPSKAPESFSGAVGKYEMSASVDKTSLSTDDAVTLTLTIAGNGDPKYLLPPSQEHLTDFEVYDPNIIEKGERERFGEIETVKAFEYLVVPKKAGNQRLEAAFTYFDSEEKKYKTIKSSPILLKVSQGKNKRNITLSDQENSNRSLTGIINSTKLSKKGQAPFGSILHLSILGLCLGGLGFIFFKKRQVDIEAGIDPSVKKRKKARSVAEKRLSSAKSLMEANDTRGFYDEISKSLFGFIADKLNVPNSEISKSNVANQLREQKIDEDIISQLTALLSKAEVAIFAGAKDGDLTESYDIAARIINHLSDKI